MNNATEVVTITDFLLQRIAEDEKWARQAARGGSGRWGSWNRSWDTEPYRDLADEDAGERIARLADDLDEHIARHDPARVLAECEAKRKVVEILVGAMEDDYAPWNEKALRALATVHADHPDYVEAWRP